MRITFIKDLKKFSFQEKIDLECDVKSINLPLPPPALINLRKSENDDIDALKVRSIKIPNHY